MTRMFSEAKGVIFDCDGTLLDSLDMWGQMEKDLCAKAGIPFTKQVADLLTTLTLPESSQWFHQQGFMGSAQEVMDEIDSYIMHYYTHRALPKPGAVEMVRRLYDRGAKLTLASSTPHAQLVIAMEAIGLDDCFLEIVSVEDVGSSKRDPAIYDYCRKVMGTSLEETWGVEDATYAVTTLRQAGYGSVAIYDRDESGSWEDLVSLADVAIKRWDDPDDLAKLGF